MADARVSPLDQIAIRARVVRERFAADGVNVSEWARERGFDIGLTHRVLTGTRQCRRGTSHKIAVALGIKDAPQGNASRPVLDRLEGVRT